MKMKTILEKQIPQQNIFVLFFFCGGPGATILVALQNLALVRNKEPEFNTVTNTVLRIFGGV
jgi:hypothetical protein